MTYRDLSLSQDHNDEIRQEQMREMQILGGRTGVLLPIEGLTGGGGDAHTDGSGSLSPPSSLSPPPTVPVKLPQSHAPLAQPPPHPTQGAVAPPMANFLAASHPAMRGLTRSQMGLMATGGAREQGMGLYPNDNKYLNATNYSIDII